MKGYEDTLRISVGMTSELLLLLSLLSNLLLGGLIKEGASSYLFGSDFKQAC